MLGDLQIAFIGGGTMGEMIISRLLSTKTVQKSELIIVSDPVSAMPLFRKRIWSTYYNLQYRSGSWRIHRDIGSETAGFGRGDGYAKG